MKYQGFLYAKKYLKKVLEKVLTVTCRYDNIIPVQEKGGKSPMIKNIIKMCLTRYQRHQAQVQKKKREAHNKEQVNLILQGLESRGY